MSFTLPNVSTTYVAVANVVLATVSSMFYLSFLMPTHEYFPLSKIYTIRYVAGYL